MSRALIISSDKFPHGNAGAIRQEVLAKLLIDNDYQVDVVGMGQATGFKFIQLSDNLKYVSFREEDCSLISRIKGRLCFSRRTINYLKKSSKYDLILIVSVPFKIISYCKRYSQKYNAILIHDSVEWYSPCEYRLGVFDPQYIQKDLNNKKWIDEKFRVIAISKYLYNYFSKKCSCVRIPFIIDTHSQVLETSEYTYDKIKFIYAGMIGRKDHLLNFLKAVNILKKNQKDKIQIDLYGFNESYLRKLFGKQANVIDSLKGILIFHGKVAHSEVENALKGAAFSILFRDPNERYAKAGFPTKVVESLSLGIPVFCNYSSDLEDYLNDGVNSVITKSEEVEHIKAALLRTLEMSSDDLRHLRENARSTALTCFDYHLFDKEIKKILER